MNLTVNDLVQKLLDEHNGGKKFFDAFDESVRDKHYIDKLMMLYKKTYPDPNTLIVGSGKFGTLLKLLLEDEDVAVVPGNLRQYGAVDFDFSLSGVSVVFIDDSFYMGGTRNRVKEGVERCGGKFLGSVVIYDGAKEKDENVHGLYRYYDNHGCD